MHIKQLSDKRVKTNWGKVILIDKETKIFFTKNDFEEKGVTILRLLFVNLIYIEEYLRNFSSVCKKSSEIQWCTWNNSSLKCSKLRSKRWFCKALSENWYRNFQNGIKLILSKFFRISLTSRKTKK